MIAAVQGAAVQSAAAHLQPETVVSLESTTCPGTTDDVVRPILVAGVDFNLVFSPKRIDPGNQDFGPPNARKVISGPHRRMRPDDDRFLGKFVETVVQWTREAEMTKPLENTYRHIKIALVNKIARFCHALNIDTWDAIGAASTKTFGCQSIPHKPIVSRRCIPIDPDHLSHYVRKKQGYPFRCVELAEEINNSMPVYRARRVKNLLNRDSNAVRGAFVVAGRDLASESVLYGAVANADASVLLKTDRKPDVDELALGAGSREALTCQ